MAREKFEHDLQRLKDEILTLGAMAERSVTESVQALKKRDLAKAQSIMDEDRMINEKRYAIENETLTVIATQQPMAGDLRTLAAIFEIATELERIADYAKGIAHVTLMLGEERRVPRGLPGPVQSYELGINSQTSPAGHAGKLSATFFDLGSPGAGLCTRRENFAAAVARRARFT